MENLKMIVSIKLLLASMVLFSIISSCNGKAKKEENTNDTTAEETGVLKKESFKTLDLKGFYVTSEHEDNKKYAASNLFDHSSNAWATMPGAGPDEGIMIYLLDGTKLSKIGINFATTEDFAQIAKLGLYIDGQYVFDFTPENTEFEDFAVDVGSIYLRILETEKISTKEIINTEEKSVTIKTFETQKPVALAEINFWDADGNKLKVNPPKTIKAEIKASSTLDPSQAYGVQNLFDSKYTVGWAEGNKASAGDGESINVKFSENVEIKKIKIWNGFQRSETHFDANAKVKILKIQEKEYQLKDAMGPQEIRLAKPFAGKDFQLNIKAIYEGSKYEDLVISEMQFFDGNQWFVPKSDIKEQFKSNLLKNAAEGSLAKVLDKWFYEESNNEISGFTDIKSIIIRSDYSFVIYEESSDNSMDRFVQQRIYDGNWSIEDLGKDKTKIRIFGKRRIINKGQGAYKGIDESELELIFHDYLTISSKTIKGERFVDEIAIR